MLHKFSEGKPYNVIALCMTRFKSYDQVRLIKELCKDCGQTGIKVIIFSSVTDLYNGGINDIGEAQIFSSFEPERFDAVVVLSESFKNSEVLGKLISRSKRADVPVISIDKEIEGCINIEFDYSDAFEQLVKHIVEYHHIDDVMMIAGNKDNPFSEERIECFKEVLEANGIAADRNMVLHGDFWADPTRAVLEKYINDGNHIPKAFICANDIMAIECMRTLKEHGYRIPEDVLVTGFDGIDLERYYSPRLTTAEYRIEDLAQTIIDAVTDNIDGNHDMSTRIVNYINRLGGSCGCKKTKAANVEERLYKEKFITDDREEFIQYMYNMIAQLSNYPELHYIFRMIPEHIGRIGYDELWMCFNNDFLDGNMDVSIEFNRNNQSNTGYTPIMKVPLHLKGDEICNDGNGEYEQCDLIPDIGKVIECTGSIIVVPIHLQGISVGYMAASFSPEKFYFSYYQTFLLDFRHILEVYVNRSTTERLYVTDVLTGIYNRHGFYRNIGEIMRRSQKTGNPFTVISMDMDGLKNINDTYGHAEGDYALKKIGELMRKATTKGEICARFGGDEFLIVLSGENASERADEIVNDIKNDIEYFNAFSNKPYYLNMSVGIYTKVADKTDTLDEYIRNADNLMYENKKENKKKENKL